MSRTVIAFALVSAFVSASALAAGGIPMPVYGDDNRQDLYQVTDPMLLKLADSTVSIFIGPPALQRDATGRNYTIPQHTLKDDQNVCDSEPFATQPDAANCSGSLVGPDLVLTAGHCVLTEGSNQNNCANLQIAFGYALRQAGVNPTALPATEVYNCASIVTVQQQEDSNGPDYALIRLNRKVLNHRPLAIDRTGQITVGMPLVVIGHPAGLPEKVAGGAQVLNTSDPHKFVANLDTYAGNSGSPVFNAQTGLIEGILVTGEQDFVPQNPSDPNSCMVSKVCANDASDCGAMPDSIGVPGERANRVSEVARFIPALPPGH